MGIDVVDARLTVLQRDVSEVNIHRVTRKILQEQVDGGTAMNGEDAFIGDYRDESEQQLDFLSIYVIHSQRVL